MGKFPQPVVSCVTVIVCISFLFPCNKFYNVEALKKNQPYHLSFHGSGICHGSTGSSVQAYKTEIKVSGNCRSCLVLGVLFQAHSGSWQNSSPWRWRKSSLHFLVGCQHRLFSTLTNHPQVPAIWTSQNMAAYFSEASRRNSNLL